MNQVYDRGRIFKNRMKRVRDPPSLPPPLPHPSRSHPTVLFRLPRLGFFKAGEEARKSGFDAIHDTQAFVAANDDMIAVVFRGTKEAQDWFTNFASSQRDCPETWGVPIPGCTLHEARNTIDLCFLECSRF